MALSAAYFETNFFVTGNATTASSLGIPLNGSQPFTVTGWAKFSSLQDASDILIKSGVFRFGVQGHQVYTEITGFPGLWSDGIANPVGQDSWHYLAVVFTGYQLQLYIDGNLDSQAGVSGQGTDNTNPYVIANNLQGKLSSVRVYNSALSAGAVLEAMLQPDPAQAYVADFDFSANPPVDRSGNNLPVTLNGNAKVLRVVPAVGLNTSAYCQPIRDDSVNPGGAGNDAYSIQGWIWLENPAATLGADGIIPVSQAIFVNQALDTPSGIALYLQYDTTANLYRLASLRGATGVAGNILTSQGTVPYNEWVNVATTYDPASTSLSLYINGQLDSTNANFAAIPALATPDILIGGAVLSTQPSCVLTLQGYVQSIDVWSICLSAAQVLQWQDGYPIQEPGISAHYAFGFALPRNEVNGQPIGLADLATMATQTKTAGTGTALPPIRRYGATQPVAQLPPEIMAELRQGISFANAPNLDELLEAAMQKELSADLHHIVPAELVPKLRSRLAGEWSRVRHLMRERPQDLRFVITYHQIHGDHILIHHTPVRSTVVFRAPLDSLDACTMWRISVIWTIVSGLLSIFGITGALTTKVQQFIQQRIFQNQALMLVMKLRAPITAVELFLIMKAMHSYGVLWPLIKVILTSMSWWALGRLLVKIIVKVFGTAVAVAETIASLVVAVAQLIYVMTQQPAGCPFIPASQTTAPTKKAQEVLA